MCGSAKMCYALRAFPGELRPPEPREEVRIKNQLPNQKPQRCESKPDPFLFGGGTGSQWSRGTGEAIFEPQRIFEKFESLENFYNFLILYLETLINQLLTL